MMHRTSILLAAALAVTPLAAGDLELSVSYGFAFPGNRNLYLVNEDSNGLGTFVQTRFGGPWQQPGLRVGYELFRAQGVRTWVQAGYATSLGGLDYSKVGQNVSLASIASETFNGTVKASRMDLGLGLTFDTGKLGEYGAALLYRSHRIALDGTLTTATITGATVTTVASGSSQSATVSDVALELSMGLVQPHPTFKTFQRISMDWGFGGSGGTVNAGDWRLDKDYLVRLKPASSFQFTFGIRL